MTNLVKILFTLLFLLLLIPGFSSARDLDIKSYVDKTEVGLTDYFNLTVEISGSIGSIPNPELPDLGDFYILSGPNESSSYQFINGAMSASKTFTFTLQPKKAGLGTNSYKEKNCEIFIFSATIFSEKEN